MAIKKDTKSIDTATIEQPTNRESTTEAPEAPTLAETNQGAHGVEDGEIIQLIAMRRDAVADGGPNTAKVHPDEVAHWRLHGWEIDPLADGFQIRDLSS